jgi:hypothetical protein
LLVRDAESSCPTRAPGEDAAPEILQSHSITYRIPMGPDEGRKAFTLQTVPEHQQRRISGRSESAAPPGDQQQRHQREGIDG